MKTGIQRITILLALLLVFVCAGTLKAQAYSLSAVTVNGENDFILEPGKAEIFVDPGQTVSKDIFVTNRTDHEVTFKVQVEDFIGSDDPNTPVVLLDGDKSPYSFKDYLIPEVQQFTLKSGQRISMPIKIDVPANQAPGGYYSSVLISNEPTVDAQQNDSTIGRTKTVSRLGVLFFIRVNGLADQAANVGDFRVKGAKQLFYTKGPFTFEVLFNNTGSVHLVPSGKIEIKNFFGKVIATVPIDAYFSLPHSVRYREVKWESGFLLGRYTAHLILNKGFDKQVEEKTIVIWVIPWKYIAIFAIVVFVIFSIFYYIRTHFEFKRK